MCAHLDSSFHYALTRLVVCAFGTFFPFDNVVGVSVFAPLGMSFQHVSVCWCVSVFVFWCVSAFFGACPIGFVFPMCAIPISYRVYAIGWLCPCGRDNKLFRYTKTHNNVLFV